MQKKRWAIKRQPDQNIIEKLSKELGINPLLATLIAQKGITHYEQAKSYFNPSEADLHDPFLMKDMEKAVERIIKAIKNEEKILIYGDYDVDGTTSVALLYNFFSKFYPNLHHYVPSRFSEGYGISTAGIDHAIQLNATLIIALDCGIKENIAIDYAAENGIEVIVCDHHTPGTNVPHAFAILNPKQIDCNYPYKELSGCAIGFKLLQAFSSRYPTEFNPFDLVDFVAVSIASDIVPITGENRIIEFLGLNKINTNPSIPFKAMLGLLGITKKLDVTDLVFIIGPRLNASGRITHATTTVDLLISKSEFEALEIVQRINISNTERKDLDHLTVETALERISACEKLKNRKTTVLYDADWHKGVIGIVASRLTETYYRPTILFTEKDGMLHGSARSVSGFDLYQALEKCSHLVEKWGGHQFAAGLSMKKENFELFSEKFEEVVSSSISDDQLIPLVEYDQEIPLAPISLQLAKTLDRFGPFGPGNMKPKFITRDVQLKEYPRIVGNDHLKLTITKDGQTIDCIGFQMGDFYQFLKIGKPFDICYTIEENVWNDRTTVQLNIKDIQFHS